jgi:hypothetical protein
MTFIKLTRPDDSPIAVNTVEIVHMAPVPAAGPLAGPLTVGTRIVFRDKSSQDVKEVLDVIMVMLRAS